MDPVIIYSCSAIEHIIYCIWSIHSLKMFGYDTIEVIVSKESEKEFIGGHLKDVSCEVIDVDIKGYGMWAFRPFALERYKIKHQDRDVVICDADILWKKEPLSLFNRFKGKPWVHKITSLNPADLEFDIKDVPLSRIGLRTMINYKQRIGLRAYPNFHLNCGLFMLPKDIFPKVLSDWVKKIQLLPPKEMIMTEALLSLTYAEVGISPVCDREDIKHLGIRHDPVSTPLVTFQIIDTPKGMYTGYQTAQHYYGDQRKLLHEDVIHLGLDFDNLLPIVKKRIFLKKIRKISKVPNKVISKLKNRPTAVIYYVVDNKGWVQHKRFLYLRRYLNSYRLKLLTARKFKYLWKLGRLRRRYLFFSSWRIAHGLIKEDPAIFNDSDFRYFMAAITSHSNIGGGLDPLNSIPGRAPKEAFNLAVGLLKRFKVVSVNSVILYELLSEALPNLLYCPNGVDTGFFLPDKDKEYNPERIKIGCVGKVRGPKNFPVIERACKELDSLGVFESEIIKIPKNFKKAPLSLKKMREFYKRIDFYLCASFNEGTPNPALEAGACGVPIITTRVGNMKELIKRDENGFFIEPTVESVIECFKKVRSMTKEDYAKMSENIRRTITNDWSWDIRVKNFNKAFEKLVS